MVQGGGVTTDKVSILDAIPPCVMASLRAKQGSSFAFCLMPVPEVAVLEASRLSCLSSPGSCDAPQQQLPLRERQQCLLPRGLRQHWPLVTSVAKLLVSFGKHTQRSLLMNIMDKC